MRKTLAFFALVAAALGCGDNRPGFDGEIHHDGGNPDAAKFPAPPALGAQIDRMGRPLITTALIGTFAAAGAGKTALKDAYNHAGDAAAWIGTTVRAGVTVEAELKTNLAVWDAFDTGLSVTNAGCGNALHYDAEPGPDSYKFAADVLADDQLYVDSSKSACTVYFALELEKVSGGTLPHATCGGRMPTRNVVDATLSMLAAGTAGLDGPANDFAPKIHGSLTPHPDVKDITFPFLGPPH
jgi:hypothetical protein